MRALGNSDLEQLYRSTPLWRLFLLALFVAALLVRLSAYTGLIGSDDLWYAQYAQSIAAGIFPLDTNQFNGRSGVTIAVAGVYRLFGVSETATIILPLLASSASVPLLAAITARLYGPIAALIAALLLGTSPIDVRHATILVPEAMMGFWILLGVWGFLVAAARGSMAIGAAAGGATAVAYLTKEPAAFVTLALVLFAWISGNRRLALATAAGALAVVSLEMGYYQLTFDNPLHRLAAARVGVQRFVDLPAHQAVLFTPGLPERVLKAYPRQMVYPTLDFGLHYVAALATAAVGVLLLRRGRMFLMLWIVLPWSFLNFGSASLQSYMPIWPSARYIGLTLAPLFVLAAGLLGGPSVWPHMARRRIAVAMLAIVCVVGLAAAARTRGRGWQTADVTALRAIVSAAAAKKVAVCGGWAESGKLLTYGDRQVEVWSATLAILDPGVFHTNSRLVLIPDALGLPAAREGECQVDTDWVGPGRRGRRTVAGGS